MLCLMFRRPLAVWKEETGPSQEHGVSTRSALQQVHFTSGFKVAGDSRSQVQTLVATGGCLSSCCLTLVSNQSAQSDL